jgi:hypothetical protein
MNSPVPDPPGGVVVVPSPPVPDILTSPGPLNFTLIMANSAQVNYAAATGGVAGYEYEMA